MASLSFNSLPLPPSQPRKQSDSSSLNGVLKPIVVRGNPPTFVSAPGRRIVAVGDLHGDLAKARCALEMAGVLSSDGQDLWTGGEAVLIQVGDILDRGEEEIAILSLLRSLSIQARTKGGAVFQVNGNHETMNVEGDFRYVEAGAFEECIDFMEYLNDRDDSWDDAFMSWVSVSKRWKVDRKASQSQWSPWKLVERQRSEKLAMAMWRCCRGRRSSRWRRCGRSSEAMSSGQRQKGVIARSSLLRPGGQLACELARHAVALKVDDWIFCHGGLLPHHVAYGIERMNREVSSWMRGFSENHDFPEIPFIATRGYDSVVWNRLYSRAPADTDYRSRQICSILDDTLEAVGAKAMVVGHTPQLEGVNCKYDHRIWRIDVGMSSGVLDSRPEVLEITDNKARVIRNEKDFFTAMDVLDYT